MHPHFHVRARASFGRDPARTSTSCSPLLASPASRSGLLLAPSPAAPPWTTRSAGWFSRCQGGRRAHCCGDQGTQMEEVKPGRGGGMCVREVHTRRAWGTRLQRRWGQKGNGEKETKGWQIPKPQPPPERKARQRTRSAQARHMTWACTHGVRDVKHCGVYGTRPGDAWLLPAHFPHLFSRPTSTTSISLA